MSKARFKAPSLQEKPRATPQPLRPAARGFRHNLWICLVLVAATFAVYLQTRQFEFVNFDDPANIVNQFNVRNGITASGLTWAFTSGSEEYWIPLTKISRMLDCQFFGLHSGMHHLTNVVFHALAALMLFAFLLRATGARWPSAFVAFVFALHPLHVESVAWVTERKDVLNAFFWFVTLWVYVRYAERPGLQRYALVLGAFGLGLMTKPMIVTLPFVLLLLDLWPLRRLRAVSWSNAIIEKVPLLAMSAAAMIATYSLQATAGAVQAGSGYPFGLRIENAIVSYATYVVKLFRPTNLAVFYPYPQAFAVWQVALAGVVIAGITALAVWSLRQRPYLAVGWFWFLGTLVPVIGIVQAGLQARADRYTYIPLVGLSIMLAWGVGDLARQWPRLRAPVPALAAIACVLMAVTTALQAAYWKNTESLFRHAIDATSANYTAYCNLGTYLTDFPDRVPEAIQHLETAVKIKPDFSDAHHHLAVALAKVPGRLPEAIAEYKTALRLNPYNADSHNNLGAVLSDMPGRLPEAIAEYETALRIKPDSVEAHANLASALLSMPGRLPQAISEYETALRLNPESAEVHFNLGAVLANVPGRMPDAIAHLQTALRIKPDFAEARRYLGVVMSKRQSGT